jgi:hypothetical protein
MGRMSVARPVSLVQNMCRQAQAHGEQVKVESEVLSVHGLLELDQKAGATARHLFAWSDQLGRIRLE